MNLDIVRFLTGEDVLLVDIKMDVHDLTPQNLSSISSGGASARLRKKYFGFAIFSYFVMTSVAVVLSLSAAGVALFLIVDSYLNGVDHPVWADITMSLLLGVWVSGKPKFYNKKKVDTTAQ